MEIKLTKKVFTNLSNIDKISVLNVYKLEIKQLSQKIKQCKKIRYKRKKNIWRQVCLDSKQKMLSQKCNRALEEYIVLKSIYKPNKYETSAEHYKFLKTLAKRTGQPIATAIQK